MPPASILELKSLVLPLGYDKSGQPVAVARVERLHRGYEQKGFFHIGALPISIAEDVSLQVRDAAALASIDLGKAAGTWGKQVQIRGFKLLRGKDEVLDAKAVRASASGKLTLGKGRLSGSPAVEFDSAVLWLGGPNAGRLVLTLPHRVETNLMAVIGNQPPTSKGTPP